MSISDEVECDEIASSAGGQSTYNNDIYQLSLPTPSLSLGLAFAAASGSPVSATLEMELAPSRN